MALGDFFRNGRITFSSFDEVKIGAGSTGETINMKPIGFTDLTVFTEQGLKHPMTMCRLHFRHYLKNKLKNNKKQLHFLHQRLYYKVSGYRNSGTLIFCDRTGNTQKNTRQHTLKSDKHKTVR